jgi:hypothetical protein
VGNHFFGVEGEEANLSFRLIEIFISRDGCIFLSVQVSQHRFWISFGSFQTWRVKANRLKKINPFVLSQDTQGRYLFGREYRRQD